MVRVLIVHPPDEPATCEVADRIASRLGAQGHEVVRAAVGSGAPDLHGGYDAVLVGGTVRSGRHDDSLREWARENVDRLDAFPNGFFSVSDEAADPDVGGSSRRLVRRFIRHTGWTPDLAGRFTIGDDTDGALVDRFADLFLESATGRSLRRKRTSRHVLTLTMMATGVAAAAAYYHRHVRPHLHDWGATLQEKERRYVGDEAVPNARDRSTYAITIDAPRTDVWPWIVQMGTGRAGWYSYDLLDNGGHQSATTVRPEYQQLQEGDLLPVDPRGIVGFPVVQMEPERHLVLGMPVKAEGREPLAIPGTGRAMIWAFHLEPLADDHATRLIVRTAGSRSRHPWADALMAPLTEAVVLFMQRKQLLGIKHRAEALYQRHLLQGQPDEAGSLAPTGA